LCHAAQARQCFKGKQALNGWDSGGSHGALSHWTPGSLQAPVLGENRFKSF